MRCNQVINGDRKWGEESEPVDMDAWKVKAVINYIWLTLILLKLGQ